MTAPEFGDARLPARFWSKARATDSGCWLWQAAKLDGGYGGYWHNGAFVRAHRVAYEALVGPAGRVLDHTCHQRNCVNPRHLQSVTHRLNGENRAGPPRNNRTGVRGVYWNAAYRKYQAQVRSGGRRYNAGTFTDLAEAEAAVIDLRNRLHTNNLRDRIRTATGRGSAHPERKAT